MFIFWPVVFVSCILGVLRWCDLVVNCLVGVLHPGRSNELVATGATCLRRTLGGVAGILSPSMPSEGDINSSLFKVCPLGGVFNIASAFAIVPLLACILGGVFNILSAFAILSLLGELSDDLKANNLGRSSSLVEREEGCEALSNGVESLAGDFCVNETLLLGEVKLIIIADVRLVNDFNPSFVTFPPLLTGLSLDGPSDIDSDSLAFPVFFRGDLFEDG